MAVAMSPSVVESAAKRMAPDIVAGMTAEQYVASALKMHQGNRGVINGPLLNFASWVGNAALAVIPKNRFFCAVGLTLGGRAGLYAAKLLSGQRLSNGEEVPKELFPKMLQPLHGVLKFDKDSSALSDRVKRLGALYTFTAISFVGVMAGAYYAYKGSREKNEKADGLEDYVARTSQHHGDKWRPLAALSGVFGSAAGYYAIPFVPGVNYGSSIAFYTVLNQDRRIMTPGLKAATGTVTNSYLGLREGMEYIRKYAVYNPSRDPAELEYLALTVLGPLANATGKKLEATQVKTFVDKIHEVRAPFWQEGGIPKEKRKEAFAALEAKFKGKGLDKTLYECGIDSTQIDFLRLNGLVGKLANSLGAKHAIAKDQAEYRAKVSEWRSEWQDKQTVHPDADAPTDRTYAQDTLKRPRPQQQGASIGGYAQQVLAEPRTGRGIAH